MPVKLREGATVAVLVVVISAVLLNLDYSFLRKKTFLEKNYLKCLTGIATEDKNFLKRKFGIRSIYIDWKDSFPSKKAKKVADEGSILMVTWEPYLKENREKSILPDIVSGNYDGLIADFAMAVKNFGKPIFLRWGHEVNGNWYSWSGSYNESSLYIQAYKHICQIFEQKNCRNAKFVFSVNYIDMPSRRWNKFENYYPGDKYVDIIGLDVYNWGDMRWWSRWKHPKKLIKNVYNRAIKLDKTKPIMLSEVATCSSGGDKSEWVSDLMYEIENKFTAIKAFVWFDWKKECNWKMTEEEKSFRAYEKRKESGFFSDDPMEFYEVFSM